MCVACLEPVALRPAEVVPDDDDFERKREEAWDHIYRTNAALANPLPICPRCRMLYRDEDRGYLKTDRCDTCNTCWIDRIVWRLIKRHGRRKAVKILKRLVK